MLHENRTHEATQAEIDATLAKYAQKGVSNSTKPVLQVNIDAQTRAKNNGFPKDMYHATHKARQAMNDEQETMLISEGYRSTYIPQHYPKFVYRRNLHPKFDPEQRMDLTDEQRNGMNPFIESRQVDSENAETLLMLQKVPFDCTAWVSHPDQIEPLPDPALAAIDDSRTIARLEGQIEELRRTQASRQTSEPAFDEPEKPKGPKAVKAKPVEAEQGQPA